MFDQSVGKVISLVGLKGIMKVLPSSNNPSLFLDIENVLITCKKDKQTLSIPAKVKQIKLIKNCFHLQLDQYSSRTAVEPFVGASITTVKSELRPLSKNEWWVKDLIGLAVYTTEGELVGTVCGAPGEHGEFLEIKKTNNTKDETVIISFVSQLVPVVDLKAGRIEIQALPGLLD